MQLKFISQFRFSLSQNSTFMFSANQKLTNQRLQNSYEIVIRQSDLNAFFRCF